MGKIAGVCVLVLAALGAAAPAVDAAGSPSAAAGSTADQRMQAYLRNLATEEETFFTDHVHYGSAQALQSQGYTTSYYKLAAGQVVVIHLSEDRQLGYCLAGRVAPHHWYHYASMNGGIHGPKRSDSCSETAYPRLAGRLRPS